VTPQDHFHIPSIPRSRSRLYIEKANNLTSFIASNESIQSSTQRLIYTQAVKMAKDAANDEIEGSNKLAKGKYKEALRLSEQLSFEKVR